MDDLFRRGITQSNSLLYRAFRPLIYSRSAQDAHSDVMRTLARLDANTFAVGAFRAINRATFPQMPLRVGGVDLPHPLMLAAGFVKGHGFNDEREALAAVRAGENIIPGWRTMPTLLGAVEFGSFTRHPRTGNAGTVIWRDVTTRSTQNRVGLKNPGAVGAAAFLFTHRDRLPDVFGINIAPTPALDNDDAIKADVIDSMQAFIAREVRPSWFTLNLSCPNTEDDPTGHQTEAQAHDLCSAVINFLTDQVGDTIPLWVKVSPCLSAEQYHALMTAFAQTGVRAVIATNTLGQPAPDDPTVNAGVGGGRLHQHALEAVRHLHHARRENGYAVDIIACGGVQDPISYRAFLNAGADAAQYWSALVFGGPLIAAQILNEDISHEL